MELSPAIQKLVLHWGEMGSRWGLNRSESQIYALLFFTRKALTAEEITETLSIARSNVSTSIRELQGWGVVNVIHKLGHRREHYQALDDVWETLQRVAAVRRNREIDPTIRLLGDTLKDMEGKEGKHVESKQQIAEMLAFFQMITVWDEEFQRLSPGSISKLSGVAETIRKWIRGSGGKPAK